MLAELLIGGFFVGQCAQMAFPEEIARMKKAVTKSYALTKEQMSASAKSTNCPLIKAYRTQEAARRNRTHLSTGEIIYFPNGAQITVDSGLKDVQIDGWWYA